MRQKVAGTWCCCSSASTCAVEPGHGPSSKVNDSRAPWPRGTRISLPRKWPTQVSAGSGAALVDEGVDVGVCRGVDEAVGEAVGDGLAVGVAPAGEGDVANELGVKRCEDGLALLAGSGGMVPHEVRATSPASTVPATIAREDAARAAARRAAI